MEVWHSEDRPKCEINHIRPRKNDVCREQAGTVLIRTVCPIKGAVAGLVGIEVESPGVGAPGRRPRHDELALVRPVSAGAAANERLFDSWFDPIEHAVRDRVRSFIEELIEGELAFVLARPRYGRRAKDSGCVETSGVVGHRHGSRTRTLTGTFGRTEIAVPRGRLMQPDGGTTEWKSEALRAYPTAPQAAASPKAGFTPRGVGRVLSRRPAGKCLQASGGAEYPSFEMAARPGRASAGRSSMKP